MTTERVLWSVTLRDRLAMSAVTHLLLTSNSATASRYCCVSRLGSVEMDEAIVSVLRTSIDFLFYSVI